MSDSDLSDAPSMGVPPDFELENSLRREVNRARQEGEDATVRQIRTASEKRLGLPDGFYKTGVWKDKSKDIIQDQYDDEKDVPSSPDLKAKKQSAQRKQTKSKQPAKRKSSEPASPPAKKRKTVEESDDESSLSDVRSETEPEPPKKAAKASKPKQAPKKKAAKKQVTPDSDDEPDEPQANDAADASESEMSVLLDEEPKPKKKSKTTSEKPKQTSKPAKSKVADDDPDQAEIKRLQGWLVKCGIRKVWAVYLKPYETPKAKIKHLKEMLADVGMTGRYSQEKASQIKEARELAEDIAAVQEGEQRWGTGGNESEADDDAEAEKKSRGRLQRGRAHYDFLSSDGEETS